MKSRVGQRGQVTIPMKLRRKLGILPGQDVIFEQRGSDLVLSKSTDDPPIRRLRALLTEPLDVDAYLEETRGPAWNPALDRPAKP